MESQVIPMERYLSLAGFSERKRFGFVKSQMDEVFEVKLNSEDEYFNALITVSEYSFGAFLKEGGDFVPGVGCEEPFNHLFYYDYSNEIDYNSIYERLANPSIRSPVYQQYCSKHKDERSGMCFDCLERYRVVTRNLIPLIKILRKDLCSIYFVDVLYDLIRFENRNLYTLIAYVVNQFRDGSSFKSFISGFGKKEKYVPLLYRVYAYCDDARTDCLDRVYDYMLYNGLSVFKTVPSELVVVGYKVGDQYCIDVLETSAVLDYAGGRSFYIASHPILESLNFGFHDERLGVYKEANIADRKTGKSLRKLYTGFTFTGHSVFSGQTVRSEDAIIVGFLKKSANTFQNFRLDIHIESIVPNNASVDRMRFIKHSDWIFEDNEADACCTQDEE